MNGTPSQPSLARRALEDLPNLLALGVFFAVTAWAFRSMEFALLVTASLGFHELGHAAALSLSGLRWRISFNILGAYTWSSLSERARLSDLRNAFIHMAGPFASLLLAFCALLLDRFWQVDGDYWGLLANFSAQVGLFNLLPLGSLTDGGKVARRLADSHLRGAARAWAIALPVIVSGLALAGFLVTRAQGEGMVPLLISLLLLGVWLTGSLLLELRPLAGRQPWRAHPLPPGRGPSQGGAFAIPVTGSRMPPAPRAITAAQGGLVVALVWGMLTLALVISAATPFWLAPRFVLGGLINVASLLMFLSGRGVL